MPCSRSWGAGRVGMHLAPRRDSHDMGDSNPAATFGYVAEQLGNRGLAFIAAREARSRTAWAAGEESFLAASMSPMKASLRKAPSRRLLPARSMPWRSASCSSPIRICPSASLRAPSSTNGTASTFYVPGRQGGLYRLSGPRPRRRPIEVPELSKARELLSRACLSS